MKIKCKVHDRTELSGNRFQAFTNTGFLNGGDCLGTLAITELSKKTLHHEVRLY
jgi:hypothetical protein